MTAAIDAMTLPAQVAVMAAAGTLGGVLNALLSRDWRLSPGRIRIHDRRLVARPGLLRSAALGAAASGAAAFAVAGTGCSPSGSVWLVLGAAAAGGAAARLHGGEIERRLLRTAVLKALSSPAAHPDSISSLAHAPAHVVLETVMGLAPRRSLPPDIEAPRTG